MENECRPKQLINSEGDFNVMGLDEFTQKTKFSECGLSYSVVAIMGPQSSGKSTLLNHLFRTNFKEMDAYEGRKQTTQGIWIQKCAGVEPFMIAMDLEGSDGSERGKDDTAFERQSALFALAIADIVIINMWCHDIGREQAASKPLLRRVFLAFMNLFGARKITLLFVLRDKTKTPESNFEQRVREDTEKIWDSVPKPTSRINIPLSEFFNVEVVALSNYEANEELFKKEVAQLRLKSILEGRLAGDRRCLVPAPGFSLNAQQIWRDIKENKDLDLPALKVKVAKKRCEEIADQKLRQLSSDKDLQALEAAIQSGQVSNFGSKLRFILETCFSEYDKEAIFFDEGVRNEKGKQLESKALEFVHPIYIKLLEILHLETLEKFKSRLEHMLNQGLGFQASAKSCSNSVMIEFDRACADATIGHVNWDNSEVREKLCQDIDSYKLWVRDSTLSKCKASCEEGLNKALSKQLEYLFEDPNGETWASIRELIGIATSKLSHDISGFELENEERNKIIQDLRDYARNIVEKKAREEAGKVLHPMTVRFLAILNCAIERKDFSKKIIRNGHTQSLRLLSVMAAMRLDDKTDKIEEMLVSSIKDGKLRSKSLTSSTWPKVSPDDTLITPAQCNSLWERFQAEILPHVKTFTDLQGMNKTHSIGVTQTVASVAAVAVSALSVLVAIAAL